MRKVRVLLVIRSLIITTVVLIDLSDVGGSVTFLTIFLKDTIFKISPICVASWAFACIRSRGGEVNRARAFSALYACSRARAFTSSADIKVS